MLRRGKKGRYLRAVWKANLTDKLKKVLSKGNFLSREVECKFSFRYLRSQ